MKKNYHFILLLLLFTAGFLVASCSKGEDTIKAEQEAVGSHHADRVAKGWRLIERWDFYNKTEGWNHEEITKKGSNGYIKVEGGVMEFGYSKDGGFIYYESKAKAISRSSYMIIARVKTETPLRAAVGFYFPKMKKKKFFALSRIRDDDWTTVKAVISVEPTSGFRVKGKIFPAIINMSRYDKTYVDWVEYWMFPRKK